MSALASERTPAESKVLVAVPPKYALLVTERSVVEEFERERSPVMVGEVRVGVVRVGDVARTKAPVPCSSESQEASCDELAKSDDVAVAPIPPEATARGVARVRTPAESKVEVAVPPK